jgi:hypothetical protein
MIFNDVFLSMYLDYHLKAPLRSTNKCTPCKLIQPSQPLFETQGLLHPLELRQFQYCSSLDQSITKGNNNNHRKKNTPQDASFLFQTTKTQVDSLQLVIYLLIELSTNAALGCPHHHVLED